MKICGECGRAIVHRLDKHFGHRHDGALPYEYDGQKEPPKPFCKNWKAVLLGRERPQYFRKDWKEAFTQLAANTNQEKKKAQTEYIRKFDEISEGQNIDDEPEANAQEVRKPLFDIDQQVE